MSKSTAYLLVFALGIAALLALLFQLSPGAASDGDSRFRLIYLTLLLLFIGSGAILSSRSQWKQNLSYGAIWLGIFLVIMIGYSYRDIVLNSRLASEWLPGHTTLTADGSITLHARADGHFYINGRINGQKILFMIDSGASDIMISKADAQRIGLQVPVNAKKRLYTTASGITGARELRLSQLQVGDMTLSNVSVFVQESEGDVNLLGMAFLSRLSSYTVRRGEMILVP